MVKKIKIKENTNINLYFVGDIHAGSKTCDKKALFNTVNMIKKDKNARVILMGDLGEYIFKDDTRRFDKLNLDKKLDTVEKQTNFIIDLFFPIRNKVYGVLRGNHESAYAKYHSNEYEGTTYRDECEFIAQTFEVPYLEELSLLTIQIKNRKYNIIATHGANAGTSLSSHFLALQKIISVFEIVPDITVMAHVHSLQTIVNPKLNYNFKTKIKHLGLSGSYYRTYKKNNINYASSCLYAPLPIGCVMYELNSKGDIRDNKIIFE